MNRSNVVVKFSHTGRKIIVEHDEEVHVFGSVQDAVSFVTSCFDGRPTDAADKFDTISGESLAEIAEKLRYTRSTTERYFAHRFERVMATCQCGDLTTIPCKATANTRLEYVPEFKRGTADAAGSHYGLTKEIMVSEECSRQALADNIGYAWVTSREGD